MRTQVDEHGRTAFSDDLQRKCHAWFGKFLPRCADSTRKLPGFHTGRHSCHEPSCLELCRSLHERIEGIDAGDYKELNGLSFFFRKRYHATEKFLLVVREQLRLAEVVLACPGRNIADRHDNNVLLASVCFREHLRQVCEAGEVTNRHKNAPGTGPDFLVFHVWAEIEVELFQTFVSPSVSQPLGNREYHEEDHHKGHAGNGGDSL